MNVNQSFRVLSVCVMVTFYASFCKAEIITTLKPVKKLDVTTNRPYGETERYHTAKWSKSGSTIVAATQDRVTVWDADDLQIRFSIPASVPYVQRGLRGISISNDGKQVALADRDTDRIRIIETESGETIKELQVEDLPSGVCLSGDGRWIALAESSGEVRVYSARDGVLAVTLTAFTHKLSCLTFLGASNYLVCGGADDDPGPTIRVFDAQTGEQTSASRLQQSMVYGVDSSLDGKIFSAISYNGTTKCFDVSDHGKLRFRATLPSNGRYCVAVSPDGSRTASAEGQIHVCDNDTTQRIASLPLSEITSISFAPDGNRLVTTYYRGSPYPTVLEIDAMKVSKASPEQFRISKYGPIGGGKNSRNLMQFNRDGSRVAFAHNRDAVRVFSLQEKSVVASLTQKGNLRNWEPDDGSAINDNLDVLLVNEEMLSIWSGSEILPILRLPSDSRVFSMDWCAPDRIVLQLSLKDNSFQVLVIRPDGRLEHRVDIARNVNSATVSPDGRWLACDEKVIDLERKTELGRFGLRTDIRQRFTGDSRFLFSQSRFLDLESGEVKKFPPYISELQAFAISETGSVIASVGRWSAGTVRIWDYKSGDLLLTLRHPDSQIMSLAMSSSNRKLAAGTKNGTLLLWDLPPRIFDQRNNDVSKVAIEPLANPKTVHTSGGISIRLSSDRPFAKDDADKALREALRELQDG